MKEFAGRVAVVTGAASGIGRALAERFAALDMKVVLADVEPEPLAAATDAIRAGGADAVGIPTDVTRADSVEALASRSVEHFGGVHLVCNNAGVFVGGTSWETPVEDYRWVLGVNLWGVIHGIRSFVPILLEQGVEAHVVNTASMAATISAPFTAAYNISKHGVLTLSETLHHELRMRDAPIGVSALCPEVVTTGIGDSERNRPEALRSTGSDSPAKKLTHEAIAVAMQAGTDPAAIARRVEEAVREERFYVFPDDAWKRACDTRLDEVRSVRNPTFTPPVDPT